MALTMTRKRTQMALTKLAQLLANVNGETDFIVEILEHQLVVLRAADRVRLHERRAQLETNRVALCITLRQFDPSIDPDVIGTSDDWFRTRSRTPRSLQRSYVSMLRESSQTVSTPGG